jgi:hypothetical protein
VNSPYDFPVLGTDVTSGSTAQVSLSAQVTYATPQVRDLTIERRHCVYENEREVLGLPKYTHGNCIAECHSNSTFLHCNCTPFFFPNEGLNHLSLHFLLEWNESVRRPVGLNGLMSAFIVRPAC